MSNQNGDRNQPELKPDLLTAYALNQLDGAELAAAARAIESENSDLTSIRALADALVAARDTEAPPAASPMLRERVEARLLETAAKEAPPTFVDLADHAKSRRAARLPLVLIGLACCAVVGALFLPVQVARESARRMASGNHLKNLSADAVSTIAGNPQEQANRADQSPRYQGGAEGVIDQISIGETSQAAAPLATESSSFPAVTTVIPLPAPPTDPIAIPAGDLPGGTPYTPPAGFATAPGSMTARAPGAVGGMAGMGGGGYDGYGPVPDANQPTRLARAKTAPSNQPPSESIAYGYQAAPGSVPMPPAPKPRNLQAVELRTDVRSRTKGDANSAPVDQLAVLSEEKARVSGAAAAKTYKEILDKESESREIAARSESERLRQYYFRANRGEGPGTEQYAPIIENPFLHPREQPLSTFSIDVDTASYANTRRFLTSGRLPPANAVRIEELVNYFRYDYPQPKNQDPFSVNMEVAECPWKEGHLLLRVGLKGKEIARTERPASNLVFLLDVSGSMGDANKLPLLKTAMTLLVRELGENDRVSIVTYAGEAGLKLPSTRGHEQEKILAAIDSLTSGGSTNGSAGIELAYEQAGAYFVKGGTNRVILCTDGDLNVGVTSDEALVKLIKQKASGGTFLTVLGFGEGNLKDAKMEKLADNGNGLYAYIDSVREARKVLVEHLTGSTITIAKDVKIQIEFNPAQISSYRLLGYENRVMAAQDFNNDKKDAGEIGAGHTVTALYELVPVGAASEETPPSVDPLRYQRPREGEAPAEPAASNLKSKIQNPKSDLAGELLTLKLRYKEPDGDTSKLLEYPLKDKGHSFHSASPDFQFAAAVASFGMILRGSQHKGTSNLPAAAEIAASALGSDQSGYRAEFLDLVRKAQSLGAQ